MEHQAEYKKRLTSPEGIADLVEPGWSCCTDIAVAVPPAILDALGRRVADGQVKDVKLHTMLPLQPIAVLSEQMRGGLTPVSWFSGAQLRAAVNGGWGDVMPAYYRDMPGLVQKHIGIDALFAVVSPMDKHGYFSTSASASISQALINKARKIFLEVNQNAPRAVSGPLIHISQVTALCENHVPLPEVQPHPIDEVSHTIGGLIAEEIPNGATLQLGIGAVPEAVGLALRNKHRLGIHTELFSDSMMELIQCGAVTNEEKPVYTGKTVATLAFGSRRVYDFIDDNPAFCLLPVERVNDPAVVAMHPNFISVNTALEIDFFGQVCAESIGTVHISGSGGQADYVRGAVCSPGGKSFIALAATAKGGEISRIRATLSPGAVVTTSKNDVDYVATEFGVVQLRGKTLSQRAKALIGIAHPKFREQLTAEAKRRNILV